MWPLVKILFDPFSNRFFWTYPKFSVACYTLWGFFLGTAIVFPLIILGLKLLRFSLEHIS